MIICDVSSTKEGPLSLENVFHRARCKGQSAFGNACTGGANLKNLFLPLAPVVQTEKTAFGPLHRRFKYFQKRFDHRMAPTGSFCRRYSYIGLT